MKPQPRTQGSCFVVVLMSAVCYSIIFFKVSACAKLFDTVLQDSISFL